ncbi:MAG: hypothetical protein M1830_010362 [Pleopsidium flavum]|nr:MAG: hypothetical protein M1830_010362 [Pleopsidium flavum]
MSKEDLLASDDSASSFFSASPGPYSGFQQEDSEEEDDEAEMVRLALAEDSEEFVLTSIKGTGTTY